MNCIRLFIHEMYSSAERLDLACRLVEWQERIWEKIIIWTRVIQNKKFNHNLIRV